jgi:hypothetical protein
VVKELQGQRVNIRKLRSLRGKLGYHRYTGTLQQAKDQATSASQYQKRCKSKAQSLQEEYRFSLALAKEAEDNIPAAIHIRNLTHQENTRRLFRRIKFLENRIRNLATTRLEIKHSNGVIKELLTKKQIEQAIIKSNIQKFHQTEGCGQLQKAPILRDIGILATECKSSQVFNGTYRPPQGTQK